MAKIFVLNNYSFERVELEIAAGKKPNHHLYAVNYLKEAGYDVVLVPFDEQKKSWLSKLSKFWKKSKLPIPIGDLFQQFYVLKNAKKEDIIYAPCQTQTQLLSYLKAIGFFYSKLIVLAHHPPIRGRFNRLRKFFFKWELKGTDAYPALSKSISDKINAFKKDKSKALHWGPDLSFYDAYLSEHQGKYFLAAGRTGRDFTTFATACEATAVPTKIICLENDYQHHLRKYDLSKKIEITSNAAEQSYLYDRLTPVMANAKVICIPLFATKSHLAGLTSLTDALALGKPVIMTRNDFIDIDIEKEGIGFWVDAMDEKEWINAINQLKNNDVLCEKMGKKAKVLGESIWNAKHFAQEIIDLIEK